MNKVLVSLLFTAFILTGISFAQNPPPAGAPAAPEASTPAVHHEHKGTTERHPEIHKAMRKLRGAKQDLEKAAHDFGGHKAKAIEAIDQALVELRAAIDFDKK